MGGVGDNVSQAITTVKAGDNVHIDKLVNSRLVILLRNDLRIANDPQAFQANPLDEIRSLNIQPTDDSYVCHFVC
jgi:2-C-methyl-D-erythritol 4-phosphate cytidylyltransferase